MTDTTETGPKPVEKTDAEKRRTAYNAAERLLREAHREEFLGLVKTEARKLGVTYEPRPTEEEKAAKQLQTLLAAHPELRSQV